MKRFTSSNPPINDVRGVHPPEAMMHFPLVSKFTPISEKFLRLRRKFSRFYLFRQHFFDFHPLKFLMTFLVIDYKFRNSFLISLFHSLPPISKKIRNSPYFFKIPPLFRNIFVVFTYFVCFLFPPYFDHDASMHHTVHVLDAPE